MRKIILTTLVLTLVLTLIFSLFSGCVQANTPEVSEQFMEQTATPEETAKSNLQNTSKTNFKYTDNGDGTCTILGYNGVQSGDLIIPKDINGLTVTVIGEGKVVEYEEQEDSDYVLVSETLVSFDGCKDFTGSLIIPESVTTIQNYIFSYCQNITSIEVSEQNKYYSSEDGILFNKDKTKLIKVPIEMKIENYVIPSSVTTIGNNAFAFCNELTGVIIPESVVDVGNEAFHKCKKLSKVEFLGNKPAKFGENVFDYCAEDFKIKYDAAKAGWNDPIIINNEFNGFKYTNNGDGTCVITGYSDMQGGHLNIPREIGGVAVTVIGEEAFGGCSDCNIFGKVTSVTIPDSVKTIRNDAFSLCSLTSIVIPKSVEIIAPGALNEGYSSNILTSIEVSKQNKNYSSVDGVLFNKDKTELIKFPAGIKMENYVVPSSVTTIAAGAFEYSSLKSITIPNSVTTIGKGAFNNGGGEDYKNGNGLTQVEFLGDAPENFEDIEFSGCASNFRILYDSAKSGWSTPEWNGYTAYPKSSLGLKNGLEYLDNGNGTCTIIGYKGQLSGHLTIPDKLNGLTVTAIGKGVFYYCSDLTGITIPNSVMTIGERSFEDCKSLSSITIPNKVTTIEDYTFYNCESLASIKIPNSITTIGLGAFWSCRNLTKITILSLETIGWSAFLNCENLTSIEVSEQNKFYSSLDGVLFNKNKTKLIKAPERLKIENYVIPESVTTIGERAFEDCKSLTNITIPENVTTIEKDAFSGCRSLVQAEFLGDAPANFGWGVFHNCAKDFKIIYDSSKSGWSTPEWNTPEWASYGYLTYPKSSLGLKDNFEYLDNGNGTCTIIGYKDTQIKDLIIPKKLNGLTVTSIGINSFYRYNNLTSITIPDSVITIEKYAFGGCKGLTSIVIPENVTSIDYRAFDCENLTQAEFLGDAPANFYYAFSSGARNFKIIYDQTKSGWSTPEWNGCPAYPKSN